MLSILIPFTSDEPHRLQNLDYVIRWYRGLFPDAEIVVGSHDRDRRGWIKAEAVRNALEASTGDILVIADADCVCDSVVAAVEAVRAGEAQWAVPHRVTRRLSLASTNSVLGGLSPSEVGELDGKGYASVAGGGITVITRETYKNVPLDPRFVTTHGEDTSWAWALNLIAGPPWTTRGKAWITRIDPKSVLSEEILWHLWHPPIPAMGTKLDANGSLARLYSAARTVPAMETVLRGIQGWKPEPFPTPLPDSGKACAIIVPVLGRPHNAATFMESFEATDQDAHVYAIADASDIETVLSWEAWGATVICSDRGSTFAQKANCGYEYTQEPWLFFVGDDVFFHPHWLDNALAAAGEFEMVSTNDLGEHDLSQLAVHPLVRRRYITDVGMSWDGPGTVAHEEYTHWFVDREWSELALHREVMTYASDSVVEHLHPIWNKGEDDETYRKGQRFAKLDSRRFQARLNEARRKRMARRNAR